MSNLAIAEIDLSLDFAKRNGYKILGGGAMFEWDNGKLIGVNAFGAVVLKNNLKLGFYPGWLKVLCDFLGINTYWYWRFIQGFDYNHQLYIIQTDCFAGFDSVEPDFVSKCGLKLRKKYKN